jgi:hypothetical protein
MSYVTIPGVTFIKTLPSGKAFVVEHEDLEHVIPNFAVSDNSEIWKACSENDSGKLVITEKVAVEKGLIDPPSGNLGGGIPLKRHRLPDPPALMSDKRLKRLRESAGCILWKGLDAMGPEVYRGDELVAIFEGPESTKMVNFFVTAGPDMIELAQENERLREWVAKALKTQERRRRR